MKSVLITILLSGIVLLGFSYRATVAKELLAPGEVRLLSVDPLGTGVRANESFRVNVFFEASGNPEIKRACFYELGEEPSCFDVTYFTLGTKRALQVHLPGLNDGSHRVECYAEYIRDGNKQKSNVVSFYITPG